jgi:hypothetical protein
MKANDLMIGDLVTIDNKKYWTELKNIPLEVTGIIQTTDTNGQHSHSISLKHINQKPNTYYEEYSQFIDYIKPIPIDDKWLLKLGFEFDQTFYNKKPLCLIIGKENIRVCIEDSTYCIYGKAIKCVHQLQNLYYVITGGEELIAR